MLVLASNSPRRKQLLALGGWSFTVFPALIDEQPQFEETPQAYVLRLALEKAETVLGQLPGPSLSDATILAADTTVSIDSRILGKPESVSHAEEMLFTLSGRIHHVYTALTVKRAVDGASWQDLCDTQVKMREYQAHEIAAYIETGDPFDKAGAYAIQNLDFHPVAQIEGCYTNVAGLPVCRLAKLLEKAGVSSENEITRSCYELSSEPCLVYRQMCEAS